jgi:hypothetical protein
VPVVLPKDESDAAMAAAVDETHARFVQAVVELYATHAEECGFGDKPLEVL